MIAEYRVSGMSCEHCVARVTAELTALDGVESVSVDLNRGIAAVTSERELSHDEVSRAIDEAGYELAQ